MCLTLGITGYLGFLDKTEGNVLNNFRANSIEANAARGLLAFTMFFTYPMECFVARHVLVKLLFKGDSDGPIDENGKPLAVFCCMTRRQVVTIAIYVLTLIPALIVNDLGPVLSITGALGGSCLCYIAPGVVYLGVNGDAFLEYLRTLCSGSKSSSRDFGEIELPVAGEANVTMTAITDGDLDQQSKPWWWYPMIMPLWVYLASSGGSGMRKKLEATSSKFNSNVDDDTETIGPCPRDYWISIFFIVFGVVAAIAGVGSNLYQFV
jgi:sodium-coupled neutral amino acid transporter 11